METHKRTINNRNQTRRQTTTQTTKTHITPHRQLKRSKTTKQTDTNIPNKQHIIQTHEE